MDKQVFKHFVETNILRLFTGSEIIGEEPSSNRDACVAQGSGGSVLIKFKKADDYRFVVKRAIPFKNFELSIIRSIIDERRNLHNSKLASEYNQSIERIIIERAICKSLTPNYHTMQKLMQLISNWSQRTYEGHDTTFGFVISPKRSGEHNPNLLIENFLSRDFCALLSDGQETFLEISSDGYMQGYLSPPKKVDENLYVPNQYIKIASLCTGSKIGVCLTPDGDILVLKGKAMQFAKRSGNWVCFSHEVIIDRLAERTGESDEVRRAVYLTALDAGFRHCGGCLVHVDSGGRNGVLKHVNTQDVLKAEYYNTIVEDSKNKSFFAELTGSENQDISFEDYLKINKESVKAASLIKVINGRKFNELDRRLRVELIGIDGATIIDHDGSIMAVGAIIKIEAGSTGGGRLAAAKTLSNYGIAIKISEDGSIQGFRMDRGKLRPKEMFSIG